MKRIFYLIIPLLLETSALFAQGVTIQGRVTDARNGTPLVFVNIVTPDRQHGTVTDIEGNFSLHIPDSVHTLKVSYVGYRPVTWKIEHPAARQEISLHYMPVRLKEVTVTPGANPAHRIIRLATEQRSRNDPEHLKQFSYTTYDKMIVTVDADSLLTCDTTALDSAGLSLRHFLEKQHLFIVETVTRRQYIKPDLNQEQVLASRISGFRDPVMVLMLTQLQSPSFYRERIHILTKDYVNPVSNGSTKKYIFILEDTLVHAPGDTTYVISYRPRRNTLFNALEGFLSINSRGWAIENVTARPARDTTDIEVEIRQAYRRFDTVWFPVQLKTDILVKKGAVAEYQGRTFHPVAHAITYLRDINLNPGIRKKEIGLQKVDIAPGATHRDSTYWEKYRTTPLTATDRETYRIIDSLGQAEHFDRYANFLATLSTGSIPLGPVGFDLDKFMHYNDYEGFYLGAGLHTNRRFSQTVRLGGFGGYGFRDKTAKYGADISVHIHKASESVVRLNYYYKALTDGGTSFAGEINNLLDISNYNRFFTRRMNMTEGMAINYRFRLRALRDFKWNFGLIRQKKSAYGNYMYVPFSAVDTSQVYRFTLFSAGFRYAFREETLETTHGTVPLGSRYPTVWFKYTRGMKGFLQGGFAYNRYDLQISDRMSTKYYGDFLWTLQGGLVAGNTPATQLFAATGTYRPFTLYAPNSFGTMRTNEFLTDRYAALFLTWDFRDLLVHIGKWKPRLLLITNFTIGNLRTPTDHRNYNFNIPGKGYYESGFVIRKLINLIYSDLGFGILYRYGPYHMPAVKDNFAYKFSIYYSF